MNNNPDEKARADREMERRAKERDLVAKEKDSAAKKERDNRDRDVQLREKEREILMQMQRDKMEQEKRAKLLEKKKDEEKDRKMREIRYIINIHKSKRSLIVLLSTFFFSSFVFITIFRFPLFLLQIKRIRRKAEASAKEQIGLGRPAS